VALHLVALLAYEQRCTTTQAVKENVDTVEEVLTEREMEFGIGYFISEERCEMVSE